MIQLYNNQAEYWFLILIITLLFTLTVIVLYYQMDEFNPEPKTQVLAAFLLGVITPLFTVPLYYVFVILLQGIYPDTVIYFLSIVLFSPITEELVKAYLLIQLLRKYTIDGPMDGLVYGIALGAGFSTIENIVYALSALSHAGIATAIRISVLRGGFAFIGHPIYTGIVGWGLGAYKVKLLQHQYSEIRYAIMLHMIWNAMFSISFFLPYNRLIQGLVVCIVILITANQFVKRLKIARNIEQQLHKKGFYGSNKNLTYKVGKI